MWDLWGRSGYMGFEVRGSLLSERESITASYEFRHFMGTLERTVLSVRSRMAWRCRCWSAKNYVFYF
jgi:hypothetical protein